GIEYRYPLTDRRLLEFVLGVPPEILWGDGRPRYLSRAALAGRTTGRVGKSDPANERQRLRAFRDCWRLLAAEAADGAFEGTCDWLDMDSLRRDIARGPSDDDEADIRTIIRMMPAVRVWHMAERFGAVSRPTPCMKAG
ncbi:MAG: asparagine synthase-related protein, partial [Armatimonadota bacterium]